MGKLMNPTILHRTLRQFRQQFLANFDRLTEQDLQTILSGSSEALLTVLHHHYGYTRNQAIQSWNEFVLRHVNGHSPQWATPPLTCTTRG